MRHVFLYFLFCFTSLVFSQSLSISEDAEISILTIGPGEGLVDKFGHTAIRVKDIRNDYVFNYGVYDFDDPNFYTKFAQGRLKYKLGVQSADRFIASYKFQDRWVKSQVLNLSQQEKQALFDFLLNNAKPENQYYLYDYFENNCATKPYDILVETLGKEFNINSETPEEISTYRTLIHTRVNQNSWGSFGIDLALGSLIDRPLEWQQQRFLPDYVHSYLANGTKADGSNLVIKERMLNKATEDKTDGFNLFSPLLVFSVLALLIMYITYRDYKRSQRTKWLDIALFLITGIIGIVLLLLWFATDHKWTGYNYNLLWAFPLNLILAFKLAKDSPATWTRKYLKLLIILLCLLCLHWFMSLQLFPIVIIPFLIGICLRYIYLVFVLKN